ncbi:hypothetical protein FB45DRAFT_1091389 [Roridomyces roridus]|uniref:F-box domain-containing protein n=1 Tax=Roridomyces roridus TaxID=1738132 RepID=A0AAD7BJ99_9AGAR|nr:hypothetical protein FB45DRAFT_1091389 [Roridomyces roridus]
MSLKLLLTVLALLVVGSNAAPSSDLAELAARDNTCTIKLRWQPWPGSSTTLNEFDFRVTASPGSCTTFQFAGGADNVGVGTKGINVTQTNDCKEKHGLDLKFYDFFYYFQSECNGHSSPFNDNTMAYKLVPLTAVEIVEVAASAIAGPLRRPPGFGSLMACIVPVAEGDSRALPDSFDPVHEYLFRSNIAPLDSEVVEIQRYIQETGTRVDALDAQIDALRARMDQLIAEREILVSRADQYKKVLSPVRRLLLELLYEIIALLPSTRTIHGHVVDQPPWKLSHTCRLWRAITLSCPFLWRSFSILHGFDNTTLYPRAMMKTQLRLTGSVPLRISLHSVAPAACNGDTFGLEMLLPFSSRWESLTIRCTAELGEEILELLRWTKHRLSSLKEVEVHATHGYLNAQWDMFSGAPRLHRIHFTNVRYNSSLKSSIPWSQLTHYTGAFWVPQHLEILRYTPRLIEGSITTFNDTKISLDSADNAVLPFLRRLNVVNADFLAYITTPSLHALSLPTPGPTVIPFIDRSSTQLTTLVMTHCSYLYALIPLLTACPALEHFVVRMTTKSALIPGIGPLFDALTMNPKSTVCPNLTSFALGWCYPLTDFSWSEGRLRSVRLFASSREIVLNPHKLVMGAIGHLHKEGFDIEYLDAEAGSRFLVESCRVA